MPIAEKPDIAPTNNMPASEADAPYIGWGVDSEVGRLREILLCRPEYWAIDKNANEVTKAATKAGFDFDLETAKRQHREFAKALEGEGVVIRWLPELPSQISQTYTRDSSFMTPWGVVVTKMQAEVRKGENAAIEELCLRHDIPIWNKVSAGTLEGGDVHVAKPGKVIIGYSHVRTSEAGARQVLKWFLEKGWDGRLIPIDPYYLHLDLLFCMVDSDTAILCKEGLSDGQFDEIVDFLEIKNIIHATTKQATKLLCNVVSLGNGKLIIQKDPENSTIVEQLAKHNFVSLPVDLTMFTSDGGGPHCLSMPYKRDLLRAT
jgi:N-dimethylarginine dimethylaminohydrolase